MSEVQNLVEGLKIIQEEDAWYGPGWRKIISGVTADMASARPVPGGHTIWELLRHIEVWEVVATSRLQGKAINEPEEGDFPVVEGNAEDAWKKTLTSFDRTHDQFIQAVGRLGQEDLEKNAPGKPYTVGFMLRGTLRHHVYHSGQIAILKKLLER